MATTTTVLITGANRGIGRGLAENYLSRPNHTVIAAVRDPSSASAASLHTLPLGSGTTLHVIKIEATSPTDPADALSALQKTAGITALDIAIANAGISPTSSYARVEDIDPRALRDLVEVNAFGTLYLYKAVYPLLKAAAAEQGRQTPKFVFVSTAVSSTANLEAMAPYAVGAYGASKAGVNYLVKRAHFENDWLVALVVEPGLAQTDMGNEGARFFGMDGAIVPVSESVAGLTKLIGEATKEKSGRFFSYDGSELQF